MLNTRDNFKKYITKLSKIMNYLACIGIVTVMLLIVLNVILRAVFKSPILGTYEYTCFLTTIVVGCSIAYCALNDGHISIGFIMEKFNNRTQKVTQLVTHAISLCFMSVLTWGLFDYAGKLMKSGELSLTTQTPFYLFVYITAIGFCVFCLVLIVKIVDAFKGVINK